MAGTGMPAAGKAIYYFGGGAAEGGRAMRALLGGKGADLAEMTGIGLPVPPGFTITTSTCAEFHRNGGRLPSGLMPEVRRCIQRIERDAGRSYGSSDNPLLVSVRSGAAISMPGMMDTILNLGLTRSSMEGLAQLSGNRRFALDAYRRLINMFGNVVMGVAHHEFERAFDQIKKRFDAKHDTDLDERGLEQLVRAYKGVFRRHARREFPDDAWTQLELAIEAVFRSWNTDRAVAYRRIHDIRGLLGPAVNVQVMVFGNMGEDSGTGVAFTRDPATGENLLYGEFLVNAQGEDVVAGIRTPLPVSGMRQWRPDVHDQLLRIKTILENHYKEMQDIEFTIERGRLWMLQTRGGKRTGPAAVKIAVDMVRERRISQKAALLRVPPNDLNQLLLPSFDPKAKRTVLTKGLPASPGAASGVPAFSADEAEERANAGETVILVRRETSPEDIHGMHAAEAILTTTGGSTSHAAVIARGWGKCCVTGAAALRIDEKSRTILVNGHRIGTKDVISIDGATGEVMLGDVPKRPPTFTEEFNTLMRWADRTRKLVIRTNADTPEDARAARRFGAEGIGLCRTEHMFFGEERITAMREMILAENADERRAALKQLLPFQRRDFERIFTAMHGLPVTIRLLDPPLHEFLPTDARSQEVVAKALKVSVDHVRRRVEQLHEINPMLGHRGCRVTITFPEILEMQVTAIVEAVINCRRRDIDAQPEIMIPLVGIDRELRLLRGLVEATIAEVRARRKFKGRLQIPIGTMLEIPRAALTADQIAAYADFFSFGTNDLTQMTLGYSRDDIASFMPEYMQRNILDRNPFQSLDTTGVGQLVEMAVKRGRQTKPKLKIGVCGEHGGDPDSIVFFQAAGLDYISCSPFRVPVARLAAAQAVLTRQLELFT
jgi:pyruvate,orthophosphate dikinase